MPGIKVVYSDVGDQFGKPESSSEDLILLGIGRRDDFGSPE